MKKISKDKIHADTHVRRFLSMEGITGQVLKPVQLLQMGITDTDAPYQTAHCAEVRQHLLFYIVRGRYEAWCQGHHVSAPVGSVLVIPMGQVRQIRLCTAQGTHLFVHARPTAAWEPTFADGFAVHQREDTPYLAAALRQILASQLSALPDAAQLTRAYAQAVEVYLLRERQNHLSPADHALTRRMDLLWQNVAANLAANWTIARMARHVGVSGPHFQAVCKRLLHVSPGQYLLDLRMDKARVLLHEQDMTLASVAQAVGYASEYSFSRLFLKHVGMRPGAYRATR